jgi:hypothetical protein
VDDPEFPTLRDFFAAHALAGHIPSFDKMLSLSRDAEDVELLFVNAAALSYRLADAMIAERNK